GEDHVEFSLFFGSRGGTATGGRRSGNRDRSRGGNAPLLFEHLRKFGCLENGKRRKVVYDFGEISHLVVSSVTWVRLEVWFRLRRHCSWRRGQTARGRCARGAAAGSKRSA